MESHLVLLGIAVVVGLGLLVWLCKWLKRKLSGLIAGVKVQLFTTESFCVATLYNCVIIGITGIVYGIRMLIGG